MWWIIGAIVVGVIYMVAKEIFKASKDPDVIKASKLRMSISHCKIYKRIFDEQTECLRANKKVPNRMDEISNMNEFRRYGEYQLQKTNNKMFDQLDKLKE